MSQRHSPDHVETEAQTDTDIRPFSSPPCYAHEVDPVYFGLAPAEDDMASRLRHQLRAVRASIALLKALLPRP